MTMADEFIGDAPGLGAGSTAAEVIACMPVVHQVTFEWYTQNANRTSPPYNPPERYLAIMGLGLAGETGELVDHIKKHVGHGHELDVEKVKKEAGDVLWYLSQIIRLTGLTFSDVARANIEKLQKRYPEGFNHEASINRRE